MEAVYFEVGMAATAELVSCKVPAVAEALTLTSHSAKAAPLGNVWSICVTRSAAVMFDAAVTGGYSHVAMSP